jgi:endonuclease-3
LPFYPTFYKNQFNPMGRITKKQRFAELIRYFQEHMPEATTELEYRDPYHLIVAVILSAQCTDKRVNIITPAFFKKFPAAENLAAASQEDVYELIKSCSYPNNKSKHLIGMARTLVSEFSGNVPDDVEQLQKLPGVGRKSANVDTHVFRVSARIGLTTNAKTPLQAETQLIRHFPESLISVAHHWLILHGRYTCTARKPKCGQCGIRDICKYYSANKLYVDNQ